MQLSDWLRRRNLEAGDAATQDFIQMKTEYRHGGQLSAMPLWQRQEGQVLL